MPQFLKPQELEHWLQQAGLHPKGKPYRDINTEAIEQCVRAFNPVRTAECFKTNAGLVCVEVTQREPLLRVVTATDSYFIDTEHKRMEVRPTVNPEILIVTGRVTEKAATNEIADFCQWLLNDNYWHGRIVQMEVNGPKDISFLQKGDQPRLIIGSLDNYKGKFKRLKAYMEKESSLQIPRYKELDVRYEGQVIGM